MPQKVSAYAAQIAAGVANTQHPKPTKNAVKLGEKPKPDAQEYERLAGLLKPMGDTLRKEKSNIAQAIFPGPAGDAKRQDVMDWVEWLAKEQIEGILAWLDDAQRNDLVEAVDLEAARKAAEEARQRADDAEAALEQLMAQAVPATVTGGTSAVETEGASTPALASTAEGTGGIVTADTSNAVVYDDEDDDASRLSLRYEDEEEDSLTQAQAAAAVAAPKGRGKPKA